jgi:hypothetical protein
MRIDNVLDLVTAVKTDSDPLNDIRDTIVKDVIGDLDSLITELRDTLNTSETLSDVQLERMVLALSSDLYHIHLQTEKLGVREDFSKSSYKEKYNSSYMTASGTVGEKTAFAESNSAEEELTNRIYARAYKEIRAKIEAAEAVLNSAKKIMSSRITERELARAGVPTTVRLDESGREVY